MSELAPHQFALLVFELTMVVCGAWLIARALGAPDFRARMLERNRVPYWNITGPEVILLVLAILLIGTVGQAVAHHFFSERIGHSAQRAGLELIVYGIGFHGLALLAWPLFRLARGRLFTDYGVSAPTPTPHRREPIAKVFVHALSTLAIALPLLMLVSFGWNALLRAIGLPDDPQDLLAVFSNVRSPWMLSALLLVACVLAPLNEELLFRGAIFRFCRQRFGRTTALLVSGLLFGALHANWAGFVPLALLGMLLALAYERTGDLRVSIVAHGLFNLNTILIVLAGLQSA